MDFITVAVPSVKLLGKGRTDKEPSKRWPTPLQKHRRGWERGKPQKDLGGQFHLHCQHCKRIEEIHVPPVLEEAGR